MSGWEQQYIVQRANTEYIYPHFFAGRETWQALVFVQPHIWQITVPVFGNASPSRK
jgi:hypothetical protein